MFFGNDSPVQESICSINGGFRIRNSYSLSRLEKRSKKTIPMILDEMEHISFNRYLSELLSKIIADRSELDSIIVTTNLPLSKCSPLFENTAMVAAMIDRLTFQSYVLDMNVESNGWSKPKKPESRDCSLSGHHYVSQNQASEQLIL